MWVYDNCHRPLVRARYLFTPLPFDDAHVGSLCACIPLLYCAEYMRMYCFPEMHHYGRVRCAC